jgi:hypothetical protein
LLQQISSCLRPRRLHLAIGGDAVLEITPEGIANLAQLVLELQRIHLGFLEMC